MLVVIDTNVLVSAPLNPAGTPARILALILQGKLRPANDQAGNAAHFPEHPLVMTPRAFIEFYSNRP